MSWRVISGLLFLYLMVVFLTTILTKVWSSNETTIMDFLVRPETPTYNNPVGGISQTFVASVGFIGALFKALLLESPIFDGPYVIVRIMILTVAAGTIIYWVISGRQSM